LDLSSKPKAVVLVVEVLVVVTRPTLEALVGLEEVGGDPG
jgi:hypothetical protein